MFKYSSAAGSDPVLEESLVTPSWQAVTDMRIRHGWWRSRGNVHVTWKIE